LITAGLTGEPAPFTTLSGEQMIRATTLTGTRDEVLEALWSMRKAGVH
jgi:hypothetical protein